MCTICRSHRGSGTTNNYCRSFTLGASGRAFRGRKKYARHIGQANDAGRRHVPLVEAEKKEPFKTPQYFKGCMRHLDERSLRFRAWKQQLASGFQRSQRRNLWSGLRRHRCGLDKIRIIYGLYTHILTRLQTHCMPTFWHVYKHTVYKHSDTYTNILTRTRTHNL